MVVVLVDNEQIAVEWVEGQANGRVERSSLERGDPFVCHTGGRHVASAAVRIGSDAVGGSINSEQAHRSTSCRAAAMRESRLPRSLSPGRSE